MLSEPHSGQQLTISDLPDFDFTTLQVTTLSAKAALQAMQYLVRDWLLLYRSLSRTIDYLFKNLSGENTSE
jgi:hypothetical protein